MIKGIVATDSWQSQMSRNKTRRCPRAESLWWVLPLFAVALPVYGQKTTFSPRGSIGLNYTDNVRFVGKGESEATDDSVLRLGLTLPWVRQLQRGAFTFSYQATYNKHDKFDSLDNLSHRLGLNLSKRSRPRSSLGLGVNYAKTQSQGNAQFLEDLDLFLNRRTDRESANFNFSYRGPFANRWGWNTSLGAAVNRFDEISGAEEVPPTEPLEDRETFHGALGIYYERSPGRAIGVTYTRSVFDLDRTGRETVQAVSLQLFRGLLQPTPSLTFSLGVFSRNIESDDPARASDSEVRLQGALTYRPTLRKVNLSLSAGHQPSGGGSRPGTSTNTLAAMTVGSKSTRRWGWQTSLRYALRDPTGEDQNTLESASLDASLFKELARNVSVRLRGGYVDQTGTGKDDRGSFYRAGLSLEFHRQQRGGTTSF